MHRFLLLTALFAGATDTLAAPRVESFNPSGSVKDVRQVQVRFSEPMVAFGDPRVPAPFDIDCPAAGTSHWIDTRNWALEFDADLPGGVRCRFTLKPGVQTVSGAALSGPWQFEFDTGGPAILVSEPGEGSQIDEEQVFLLGLDAPASRESIEAHAHCRVDGVNEAIGVEVLAGDGRSAAIDANPWFVRRYAATLLDGRYDLDMVARTAAEVPVVRQRYKTLTDAPDSGLVALRCRQRLPNSAKMALDWGPGVTTLSEISGQGTQSLAFEVRPTFRASFSCERINRGASCNPILGMTLGFSAVVYVKLCK